MKCKPAGVAPATNGLALSTGMLSQTSSLPRKALATVCRLVSRSRRRRSLAVIQVIEEEDLKRNAAQVGGYLRQRLEELKGKHSVIGDVRGMGLMQGIE